MILLPANLAPLADIDGNMGVRITETDTGYEIAAIDTYVAAIIMSNSPGPVEEYPELPEIRSAPSGLKTALVPSSEFRRILKSAPKKRGLRPVYRLTAVICGRDDFGQSGATFISTDLDQVNTACVRERDTRFPDIRSVIPTGQPVAKTDFNTKQLLRILTAAASLVAEDTNARVSLEFHADGKPLVVRAKNSHQEMTGLVMPLAEQGGS